MIIGDDELDCREPPDRADDFMTVTARLVLQPERVPGDRGENFCLNRP
jgi:hypothetical protein